MTDIKESRILLVDDNHELQKMLRQILRQEGFVNLMSAFTCQEAKTMIASVPVDLLILDVMLPDGDGFALMEYIRKASQVPVLFLSARDEDEDRLRGLGLGADDYLTKPFLPRELVLRLSLILKRTYFPMQEMMGREPEVLRLGARTVDMSSAVVRVGETEIPLTAKELTLLSRLARRRGTVVTFDALSQALWGDAYYGYENSLMVHVRHLREKIEECPSRPVWLLTVRGLGYKLAKENI